MKVLLIEDEPGIAELVSEGLARKHMTVTCEPYGHLGLERALAQSFDAVVLDLTLPGMDGLEVLRRLREAGQDTPVLLLTARNELGDRITGLQMGADDYLAKPFYVEELAVRLEAIARRLQGGRQQRLVTGPVVLDRIARTVTMGGRAVELTSREFSLLEHLMRSAGTVFTRAQILEQVWGYDFDPATNVVDVCIKRVRAKLQDAAVDAFKSHRWIESVRGLGYRFVAPQQEEAL